MKFASYILISMVVVVYTVLDSDDKNVVKHV